MFALRTYFFVLICFVCLFVYCCSLGNSQVYSQSTLISWAGLVPSLHRSVAVGRLAENAKRGLSILLSNNSFREHLMEM